MNKDEEDRLYRDLRKIGFIMIEWNKWVRVYSPYGSQGNINAAIKLEFPKDKRALNDAWVLNDVLGIVSICMDDCPFVLVHVSDISGLEALIQVLETGQSGYVKRIKNELP